MDFYPTTNASTLPCFHITWIIEINYRILTGLTCHCNLQRWFFPQNRKLQQKLHRVTVAQTIFVYFRILTRTQTKSKTPLNSFKIQENAVPMKCENAHNILIGVYKTLYDVSRKENKSWSKLCHFIQIQKQ